MRKRKHLLIIIILLILSFVGFVQQIKADGPPLKITVQGRLTDSRGSPITVPSRITFSISGGTRAWTEEQNITPTANGVFSTMIGGNILNPLPLFNKAGTAYYLEISRSGVRIGERLPLVSVPFALTARNALGCGRVDVTTSGNAVKGISGGADGIGVLGINSNLDSTARTGVKGKFSSVCYGDLGKRLGNRYYGVYGRKLLYNGYGVYGESSSKAGVRGEYSGTGDLVVGELGTKRTTAVHTTQKEIGVFGSSTQIGICGQSLLTGVYGSSSRSNGTGVYAYSTQVDPHQIGGSHLFNANCTALFAESDGYSLSLGPGQLGINKDDFNVVVDRWSVAGQVIVPEGETRVAVTNKRVTQDSIIFVAAFPYGDNDSNVWANVSSVRGGSFTIDIYYLRLDKTYEYRSSTQVVVLDSDTLTPGFVVSYLIITPVDD